jgi:hypothetical protein
MWGKGTKAIVCAIALMTWAGCDGGERVGTATAKPDFVRQAEAELRMWTHAEEVDCRILGREPDYPRHAGAFNLRCAIRDPSGRVEDCEVGAYARGGPGGERVSDALACTLPPIE